MRGDPHDIPYGPVASQSLDVLLRESSCVTAPRLRRSVGSGQRSPLGGSGDWRGPVNPLLLVGAAPVALVVFLGAALSADADQAAPATVSTAALPALARDLLPDVEAIRAADCPQLPLVWLLAEVQAESGWDPHAYSSAGAAGLLQMRPASWTQATGQNGWDPAVGPAVSHPVFDPRRHLAAAVPWMCGHLRAMADYLQHNPKPVSPLDALAVCHIAGCSRVTGSATGIPSAGEAGCGADCARQVRSYLDTIHRWVEQYARPDPTRGSGVAATAAAYVGANIGCVVPDPTGTGGCITEATAWMLAQAQAAFPATPATCWDAHPWNPTSDHPQGKACDFTFGRIGSFPGPADTARGWSMAQWLRGNAGPLHVSYLIWQGRIWSAQRADQGWRAYTGGGVYDPTDPTGGHYDHVHVSVDQ